MTSLNGDVFVRRNGRSTSQVSIYNYPEHLNPFYEDDQHKRLRFWHIGKSGNNGERRNSFSLGGLKDVWAFKSFRLKKKSSTLGINKTSESPPPLRRDMQYGVTMRNDFTLPSHQDRYSTNDTASNNNNFPRNAVYRSSLQNVHPTKGSPVRMDFNRNDQYRSTIQMGTKVSAHQSFGAPPPRRYVYGGSVTPQPLRSSDFGRGDPSEVLARGSSQISVASTNPFDTDEEEDNEDISIDERHLSTSTPIKKVARKKRRAPAPPPVAVHKADNSGSNVSLRFASVESSQGGSQPQPDHDEPLHIEESISIANLTAEIESFVKVTNDDSADANAVKPENSYDSEKPKQNAASVTPLKSADDSSTKSTATSPQSSPTRNDTPASEEHHKPIKPQKPPKRRIALPEPEVGHVECIHVHVGSARSTPEPTEPSRVTSFRTDAPLSPGQITAKTSFTLSSPPAMRREPDTTVRVTQKTITTTQHTTQGASPKSSVKNQSVAGELKITEQSPTNEHRTGNVVKPVVPVKPNLENKNRVNTLAEIHRPSRGVIAGDPSTTERIVANEVKTPEIGVENAGSRALAHTTETPVVNGEQDTRITSTATKQLTIAESHENVEPQIPKVAPRHLNNAKPNVQVRTVNNVTLSAEATSKSDTKPEVVPAVMKEESAEACPSPPLPPLTITESHENLLDNNLTSHNSSTVGASSPTKVAREEFEYLYRPKPMSLMEWKQSSLAPLETNVPPEKRKSVKDIIESINRSQRLLNAAALKDPTRAVHVSSVATADTTTTYGTPIAQRKFSEPNTSLEQSLRSLDDAQCDIQRIFQEISVAKYAGDSANVQSNGAYAAETNGQLQNDSNSCDEDAQKLNNSEIFKKCSVKKEVYDYRETSPTTSNLDWNPVPKPKRNKNLAEH